MHVNDSRALVGAALLAVAVMFIAACGDDSLEATPSPTEVTRTPRPGTTPGPGVTGTEIIIGMTNDLSGEGATPYAAVTTAMQAYFAAINGEQGGVCGRHLTLITADDRYTPEIALEETKRLVAEENVLAIVGAQNTEAHKAVAAYLNDPNGNKRHGDGIPDLFVSTGWSGWGDVEKFPWTFGFIPDYYSDASVIAEFINQNHEGENAAILYEDSDFGSDYVAGLEATIADAKLLVSKVKYAPPAAGVTPTPPDGETADAAEAGEPDVPALVDALVKSKATVVVLASTPDVTAEVYRVAAEKKFAPQFFLSYVNTPSTLAAGIGGGTSADHLLAGCEALDGTITTEYLLNLVEDEGDPALVEHQRIMETYDGPPITTLSTYGQALAETVVETLSRACSDLSTKGVLTAAESLSGFRPSLLLPGIEINLSPEDHRAIQELQPVRIYADGNLTHVGGPIDAEGGP
jgi:branched-chain amino acid transport system substrate-binding protein